MDISKMIFPIFFLISSIYFGVESIMKFSSRVKKDRRKGLYYAAFSVAVFCYFLINIVPLHFFGSWSDAFWWALIVIGSLSVITVIVILVLNLVDRIAQIEQKKRRKKERAERRNRPLQVDFDKLKSANPDDDLVEP